jgi:hypothetical protein
MKSIKIAVSVIFGLFLLTLIILPLAQAAPPTDGPTAPPAGGTEPFSASLPSARLQPLQIPPGTAQNVTGKKQPSTNMPIIVTYDGEKVEEVAPLGVNPQEMSTADIGALNLTELLSETYETGFHSSAAVFDGNGAVGGIYSWNRIPCNSTSGFPVFDPGTYSIWPAALSQGSPNLDACLDPPDIITVTELSVGGTLVITPATGITFPLRKETALTLTLAVEGGSDPITWTVALSPVHGLVTLSALTGTTVTVSYTPTAQTYIGPDSFTLGVTNGLLTGTAVVSLTIEKIPPDSYPPLQNAWIIYGPFDLSDVEDASLDFYYRFESPDPDDFLFWGASVDGINFEGERIYSGTFISGPFPNGHNFATLDLTNVPVLGDVTGSPQGVYVAFLFSSDGDDIVGEGPFIDQVTLRKNSGKKQVVTVEDFETTFPDGYESWLTHDNNGISGGNMRWGSVNCDTQSGNGAMWFARYGAEGFDPCSASSLDDLTQRQFDSWLLYGPFNLKNTSEAWVDFYFKSDTEQNTPPATVPISDDIFYWWASTDGTNYSGPGVSGTYLQGPYGNDHNLMRYDLSNHPVLGDLRGQPNVWLAFVFQSNSNERFGQVLSNGVFIDDVSVVTFGKGPGANQVYVPALIKSPPPVVGGLTFSNYTGNPVVIEIVGVGTRRFPGTTGPHTWTDIRVGEYDWVASGTCPAGKGQVGSALSSRQKVTITADQNNAVINVENGGKFDCSG